MLMHPRRFLMQPFTYVLAVLLVTGVCSTVTLMPGVAGAARKTVHPAISATGETLSYYAQGGSGDLLPNSQSVIKNPKADLIFEDDPNNPFWETTFSDSQVNYGQTLTNMQVVEQYFTDVSGSALEGILSQYSGISNTITLAHAVVLSMNSTLHSDLCGTNTISDSATDGTGIADIWNAVATQGPIDSSTIYFVFTPKNYNVYGPNDTCSQDSCGYHDDFLGGEGIYAVIPFGGGHCGPLTSFADTNGVQIDINTASHEQFEAITDPGAGQVGTSDGWHDSSGFGGEIGDKCGNNHPGAYLNGHVYPDVQGEYDNSLHGCVYSVAPTACSSTNETDNNEPGGIYTDNRGNTWHVYYDIKRDAVTNLPCQMRVVVRIFDPAPNGLWQGTTGVFAEVNGGVVTASIGKYSGSGTYQAHLVWRGPWFNIGPGAASYHIEDTEYNGSNAYIRAFADFTI